MADNGNEQVTAIVAYEVAAEDAERFLDSWEKANDCLRSSRGSSARRCTGPYQRTRTSAS